MVIFSSFKIISLDKTYYHDKFSELNVYSNQKLNDSNLVNETKNLLKYLEQGDGEIQTNFFNTKEKKHLIDVRDLFKLLFSLRRFLFFFSIILTLFLIKLDPNKERFLKSISHYLIIGSLATIFLIGMISMSLVTFESSFTKFHEVFFEEDTWLFDPATDNIINMFPQQFFYDITKDMFILSGEIAAIILAIGLLIYYRVSVDLFVKKLKKRLFG